jgi:hypothetical protein
MDGTMGQRLLDPARLAQADTLCTSEPFNFVVARGQLPDAMQSSLLADFPKYRGAGFFPYEDADCGPTIRQLVAEATAPEFARALGERLGLPELDTHPTLVTLCRSLNRRHGTIHTDSKSKVATALIYLSPDWPHGSAGALRFLDRPDAIDAQVAQELPPVYGNLAAFRRSDNSFHGHLPFEGERPVVQIAWLASAADLARKQRRGRFSRALKAMVGRLDAWWGSRRHRDAAHRD